MGVNFALLKKPAGLAKKPTALPAGEYPGIIKTFEVDDKNKNNTPYVRFQLALTGWPDSVDEADRSQQTEEGKPATPIDLSKRQLRRDMYLTDDALWRLDALIRALGIDPSGRSYEEILPETTGKNVLVEVQQYLNQTTSEIGNQVGGLKSAE